MLSRRPFLTATVVVKLDSVLSLPNCIFVFCFKMFYTLCGNSQLPVLSSNIEVTEKSQLHQNSHR